MDKDIFIKQLKDLIAFRTVTGDVAENSKALNYVEKILPKGVFVKRVKNKTAEILIASTTKSMSPKIGYLVHIDVVAGSPDQFIPKVVGDKIIGRGASDMKFSIPIGVALLKLANEKKISFSLAITTDEEVGGHNGGHFLVKNLKFNPICLIVPDGGHNLTFVNKSKGVCQIAVESTGTSTHASRPWTGKNAIEPLVILGQKLVKRYSKHSLKPNWNTTMNIGVIQGGESVNQVCNHAVLKLDFRFPETNSSERILKEVKTLAQSVSKDLTVEIASAGMPTFTNKSLLVVKDFISCMEKKCKKAIKIEGTYGASDARFFTKLGTPILMMKPVAGGIHSENEWISVNSSLRFFEGLKMFVEKYG